MTTAIDPASAQVAVPASAVSRAAAVPWHVVAVVFASTSVIVGVIWDISWHRTIGRDTFFTPAHLAIYAGGIVAGLSCGWLVLRTTFAGTADEKGRGVRFWGFRGPLGAWICIWGSFAMITSGPFDDWWHNAYGLDVEILSPPHTVLALGIIAIQIGALLMVLAMQNNETRERRGVRLLYAYTTGLLVVMLATLATEYIAFPNAMHGSTFYAVSAGLFPVLLVGASAASKLRWGATAAAAMYIAVTVAMIWTLQLFEARPLLGPIYNPVDHMVPPAFPLLLVIPAAVVDLIMQRRKDRDTQVSSWVVAAVLGVAFTAVFVVTQWFFADFLLSPAARNFVFAADRWDYSFRLGDWRYQYWGETATVVGLLIAAGIGVLSSRVGLAWGNWMARVRR